MSIPYRAWAVVGLVTSFLPFGCGKGEIVISAGPTPNMSQMNVPTPKPTATMAPDEVVSAQDPALTVCDIHSAPARLGHVARGTVTNRGQREYSSVTITLDCLDAKGTAVGTGRDSGLEFRPGDQWHFRTNVPSDSVRYKVTELRGY